MLENVPHVNVSPFVDLFKNALDAAEQALNDARQELAVILIPRVIFQGAQCLHQRHQEAAQADAAKGVCGGPPERVANGLGAA